MSELERTALLEINGWRPVANVRPHHLEDESGILIDALLGLVKDPTEIVNQDIRLWKSEVLYSRQFGKTDLSGYDADVLGHDMKGDTYAQGYLDMLNELAQIHDDSDMLLSPGLDKMCKGCAIGNHCTAVNYKDSGESFQDFQGEAEALGKIYLKLVGSGSKAGTDFIFQRTTHAVFDYGGQPLNTVDGLQIRVLPFRSMLVKAGSLRKAYRAEVVRK